MFEQRIALKKKTTLATDDWKTNPNFTSQEFQCKETLRHQKSSNAGSYRQNKKVRKLGHRLLVWKDSVGAALGSKLCTVNSIIHFDKVTEIPQK